MSELLRVIGDGKDLPDNDVPDGLGEKDLIELYRWLVLLRAYDERSVALQRQGRIGTYALYWGEEATQAGALYALEETDWIFPSYRQNSIAILRGVPASVILAWWRGYGGTHGFYDTREYRCGPICVPIGTHLPHAVGTSWAAKMKGERTASLAWFGDGATSEGDFHEALNFASVFKTATIFFCTNNQWAISTPVSKQMATETVAEKAVAYAMPSVRVDGFDPLACWKATKDAADLGRDGGGPTLIEAYCYRIGAHGTADDPRLYRDESETDRWKALEPVSRMEGFLDRISVMTSSEAEEIKAEAKGTIAEAVKEMEALEEPDLDVLFEHVYAKDRPWMFDEGLEELRTVGRRGMVKPLNAAPGEGE